MAGYLVALTQSLLSQAREGDFSLVGTWLEKIRQLPESGQRIAEINAADNEGRTALHWVAAHERTGKLGKAKIKELTSSLLEARADPHRTDHNSETPFNIAAPSSPVTGRLMTLCWLDKALKGEKPGLNETSGAHRSTLAQYMAKWLSGAEVEEQLKRVVDYRTSDPLKIAIGNDSGWTPLHAAAAMGNADAVKAFAKRYTAADLQIATTEGYTANYTSPEPYSVIYPAGQTAAQVAETRLHAEQERKRDRALVESLKTCTAVLQA